MVVEPFKRSEPLKKPRQAFRINVSIAQSQIRDSRRFGGQCKSETGAHRVAISIMFFTTAPAVVEKGGVTIMTDTLASIDLTDGSAENMCTHQSHRIPLPYIPAILAPL